MQSLIRNTCFLLFFSSAFFSSSLFAAFPEKPVKLIVYTKPGGAVDVFARKFSAVATKYSDATFLVVNKTGAGGIVALKHILQSKNDGYTIGVVTRSVIGKMVSSRSEMKIEDYSWMALMVSDPEAIITNRNSSVNTWEQLVADAKVKDGKQLWFGPASGGNDHIMAIKTWEKAGIKGRWIPYKSGGKAMAALMGGHGIAYVGNPGDVLGKPDLKVAAISSKERLKGKFADVPTFAELGVEGHDDEIMWRGFMSLKGMPEEAVNYFNDLFEKVNKDPSWIKYIEERGANPVFYREAQFTDIVKSDRKVFEKTLEQMIITEGSNFEVYLGILLVLAAAFTYLVYRFRREYLGNFLLTMSLILLCLIFWILTWEFPEEYVGPGVIPKLWGGCIILLCAYLLSQIYLKKLKPDPQLKKMSHLAMAVVATFLHLYLMDYIGYYLTTFFFFAGLMYFLDYRNHLVIWSVASGWIAFSYLFFYKLLYIQLPEGVLFVS